MSRSLLTRLAVAAGCLAPAAAAAEDVVWLRPGAPPPPDRPPAVVEDRPPTLPPVVRVEARAEPAPVRVEPTTSRPGLLPSPLEGEGQGGGASASPPGQPYPPPGLRPTSPSRGEVKNQGPTRWAAGGARIPDGYHLVGSSRQPVPVETAQPQTPTPSEPMGTGDASTNPSADGAPPAATPADAAKPPQTWHGLKHPVQPFAPAGASPVAPTAPGYYSLLDELRGKYLEKPPRWPYPRGGPIPPSFAEFDFSYLDALPWEQRDWAERLHRVPAGDHWLLGTGGEFRTRYNYETNSRLSGKDNTYQLFRGRAYGDVWYEDRFRFFGEFLYADSIWQDLPPLTRDVNRGDIQQMFFDVKLWALDNNPIYARVGRQELLYGSQRLVSTNDWGDNRTRFDGLKLFYRSEKLDADAFLTRPTQVRFGQLDPWDRNQTFSGAWLTYKPKKGTFVDLYYLDLENDNPGVARGQFRTGSYNVSTFGSRYYGRSDCGFLLDVEGMLQFGHWADQSILAQALSAYAGWYFKDVWATPTVWVGYDYASGDPDPNATGQHRTFNQLFQFGHYYYGFVDITGGQNIRDFNLQAYAYPSKWITTGLQYHVFRLDSNKDALYNFAGQVLRQDKTGKAGDDVGSELDLLVNFHVTDRQDVFVNYCRFFTGPFIKATGPSFGLDYVYLQYSLRW